MANFVPRQSFLPLRSVLERRQPSLPLDLRVTRAGPPERGGDFVLYWMQAARRIEASLGMEAAIAEANRRALPLLVYESIRPDTAAGNLRVHQFVLEGAGSNRAAARARGASYRFFLPKTADEARGVLLTLAGRAALVVTDDYPAFVVPRHNRRLAASCTTPVLFVDGNGILPMRAMPGEQYSARFFRDRAHRLFEEHWWDIARSEVRVVRPVQVDLPDWDGADPAAAALLCEIDSGVPALAIEGGPEAAARQLEEFIAHRLTGYGSLRNRHPAATSGLSPYLHFGHIGMHQVAGRVLFSGAPAEDIDAFLEEAVIRRELSFNLCHFRPDYAELSALPKWALATLDAHRRDLRRPAYTFQEMEQASTGDDVWNLAQRGLLRLGTIHGYLRMVWGKRIVEWSATPEEALDTMLRLHDRWAIDGRDPNTYAGALWCLGKHDRPWAPERPIFGTIRYMSSEATRKKVDLKAYEKMVDQGESG